MSLTITPETKVGALLDAYPGIENQLAAWVPAFQKLHNPVLRRTVAKVVSLEQAASVGGIGVAELIARLRRLTGQDGQPVADKPAVPEEAPAWLTDGRVVETIDAIPMLEQGIHPIGKVREVCARLEPGELLQLLSPFRPQPLIDTMRRGGLQVFSAETAPGAHSTWFAR
ncbi:MAG: DUF1858 domain-containing protein [Bryobacterales bacterium]|nr:DUF1858 domain-containing protein [Bryobacterales bacterium]